MGQHRQRLFTQQLVHEVRTEKVFGRELERVVWHVGLWLALGFGLMIDRSWAQQATDPLNPLPMSESAAGSVLLFDGTSPYGWQSTPAAALANWQIDDGVYACPADAPDHWLIHRATFADFQLQVTCRQMDQTKVQTKTESTHNNDTAVAKSGTEQKKIRLALEHSFLAPLWPAELATDQWQTVTVTVVGDRVTVHFANQKIIERQISGPAAGSIGIYHQAGTATWQYRDLKIKPLGMQPLFNAEDLTGWQAVHRPGKPGMASLQAEWSVRDGNLHVEVPIRDGLAKGGQGQLETTAQFQDFILQLQVRTNGPHLNSGVFFRNLPGQVWAGYEAQIRNQWEGNDRNRPVDYGTGGIYNRMPARRVVSADNTFFQYTIAAADRQFFLWVDGYPVCHFVDDRPAHESARQGYRATAGTIALQSHDPTTNIDFRQIQIVPLPAKNEVGPTTTP